MITRPRGLYVFLDLFALPNAFRSVLVEILWISALSLSSINISAPPLSFEDPVIWLTNGKQVQFPWPVHRTIATGCARISPWTVTCLQERDCLRAGSHPVPTEISGVTAAAGLQSPTAPLAPCRSDHEGNRPPHRASPVRTRGHSTPALPGSGSFRGVPSSLASEPDSPCDIRGLRAE